MCGNMLGPTTNCLRLLELGGLSISGSLMVRKHYVALGSAQNDKTDKISIKKTDKA